MDAVQVNEAKKASTREVPKRYLFRSKKIEAFKTKNGKMYQFIPNSIYFNVPKEALDKFKKQFKEV